MASGLDAEKAFEGVEAGARAAPVVVGVPLELGLHRLRHAPTVGEAELGEDGAGGSEAEVLDQVLSQQPHRHRVKRERTLTGEADHASIRVQLQQLFMVQIVGAQAGSPFKLKEKVVILIELRHGNEPWKGANS